MAAVEMKILNYEWMIAQALHLSVPDPTDANAHRW